MPLTGQDKIEYMRQYRMAKKFKVKIYMLDDDFLTFDKSRVRVLREYRMCSNERCENVAAVTDGRIHACVVCMKKLNIKI